MFRKVFALLIVSYCIEAFGTPTPEPTNLSQLLHCLAIVNGAESDGEDVTISAIACPVPDLAPIRFVSGTNLRKTEKQRKAVRALARVLRSRPARGLEFRLVGHSDQEGKPRNKRRISLKRAKNLRKSLSDNRVPWERMVVQGRSDSEPFGASPDTFGIDRERGDERGSASESGGCKYGDITVNCDRRASIEVVSPLVARYGSTPSERKPSSRIDPQAGPHVRFFPKGLAPGDVLSIDLAELGLPGFKPRWRPECGGVTSTWKEIETTDSLFDKRAGKLWARARLREVVTPRKSKGIEILLDLAAGGEQPIKVRHQLDPSYPDYWAMRIRVADDPENSLTSLFDALRVEILGDQTPPDCSDEDSKDTFACGPPKDQARRHRAAERCLSTLLDDAGEIDGSLITSIEEKLISQMPMHGDDRLAQAHEVNAWTASFSLEPGMELCLGETAYIYQSGNNDVRAVDSGSLSCIPLRWVSPENDGKMAFATWLRGMRSLLPGFPGPLSGGSRDAVLCEEFQEAVSKIPRIKRAEQLGCLGTVGALRLFPYAVPQGEGDNDTMAQFHVIAASKTRADMDAFIRTINEIADNSSRGLKRRCKEDDSVQCAYFKPKKPINTTEYPLERHPRLSVTFGLDLSDGSVVPVPVGTRVGELAGVGPFARGKGADIVDAFLLREFGRKVVIEHSSVLYNQWPAVNPGANQ